MFWQKPFVLLGLLAGLGSAAPTLSKRLDLDMLNEEFVFFRADRRGPDVIKKEKGFETMAKTNKLPENISLWDHCKVKGAEAKFGNLKDDGYVSTSSDFGVCLKWVTDYIEDPAGATIYKIASDRNLIGCHDTLKQYNPLPDEQEYAAIGGIPWEQVMGWYNQFTLRGKTITDAVFTPNPTFVAAKYNEIPEGSDPSNGGEHYRLAGWPKGDKRWKEAPWNTAVDPVCGVDENPKKPKKGGKKARRDIEDIEINEEIEINEDAQLVPESSDDDQLAARAPAKKPKKPTKTPTKTPTKPPTKPPGKDTCTAAEKKKNGGKCPAQPTCTAAEKKANGGTCPTCTAAEKKANGGKCPATPTCTAAEKKANGGTCPTCTAAEKKKNGGKCPPKVCALPKTNKQLADEYLKLFKAGQLGKGKGKGKPAKPKGKTGAV
ncbi:hypothetical protein C7974DRAFT_419162 [Boeremia exigua]|uniref:uncharacterized protein n=1 Tax=Boeremia exigua TaxID=749465 RepID=UPI001E8E1DAA|nr:uncharacterized protein C7974DRAFT_419162 [Boeremia exigua]KAH6643540.1 hypothetical protein C7974DRAFT_419162 [Boeremia exigua]